MSQIDSEAAKEKWSKIAENWKALDAPVKPGDKEIEIYKAVTTIELSDKENVKAVILGSTPELRDMCSEFFDDKLESVTCVDVTEDMFYAMSELVKQKNPKEKYISGNWLELKDFFEEKSVDIIFGDHIVSNVGGKEAELFQNIKTILKDDGCFVSKIQHVDITDDLIKPVSAYEKLQKYATEYKNGKINLKTAFSDFGMNLLFSSYHLNDKNEMSFYWWGDQIDKLNDQVKENGDKYEKEILEKCQEVWWNWRDIRWTQYEKSAMHKIIEDNFYIKDEVAAPGHEFSRQTSIYRLKKN